MKNYAKVWFIVISALFLLICCSKYAAFQAERQSPDTAEAPLIDGDNKLGLRLRVADISPSGLRLICSQSGGHPTGTLQTGAYYSLEKWEGESWQTVDTISETYWQLQAFTIEKDQDTEFRIDWEWLYGKLNKGTYRLEKRISDFRQSDDKDDYIFYADFEIPD